jgi:hypothetical protein
VFEPQLPAAPRFDVVAVAGTPVDVTPAAVQVAPLEQETPMNWLKLGIVASFQADPLLLLEYAVPEEPSRRQFPAESHDAPA